MAILDNTTIQGHLNVFGEIDGTTLSENGIKLIDKYLDKSGGTMTGPITIAEGDGKGILMSTTANINVTGTSNTILGFLSNEYTIGNGSYNTNIRGGKITLNAPSGINIITNGAFIANAASNADLELKSVSATDDYFRIQTTGSKKNRTLFIQPDEGNVNIGGKPLGNTTEDKSAKLIVNGDIKESGKKLSEKYALISDTIKYIEI